MIGDCGTSKNGARHCYYTCSGRKYRKGCKKKSVKKEWIENTVVRLTLERVLVPGVIERIADAAIDFQRRERNKSEAILLRKQLQDTERLLRNVMVAIEQGIITETTKSRLEELEEQRRQLKEGIELAELELTKISREQIIFFLETFRDGDISDEGFRWKVVENFVNAVYLYDDRIRIVYNYTSQGAEPVDFAFMDAADQEGVGVFDVGVSTSTKTHQSEHHTEIICLSSVFVLTVPLPLPADV